MKEFLLHNWQTFVAPAIVGYIVWYYTKRNLQKVHEEKARSEVTSSDLANITDNFKVYQAIIDDLENRFKTKITELEEDLSKMKVLNEELRKAITNQEKYIKKLQAKLENYEKLDG